MIDAAAAVSRACAECHQSPPLRSGPITIMAQPVLTQASTMVGISLHKGIANSTSPGMGTKEESGACQPTVRCSGLPGGLRMDRPLMTRNRSFPARLALETVA